MRKERGQKKGEGPLLRLPFRPGSDERYKHTEPNMQKPSIPKGTRDFSPVEMMRRNYIFDTIRSVFRTSGFAPLAPPAMENLSTLLGKYGD